MGDRAEAADGSNAPAGVEQGGGDEAGETGQAGRRVEMGRMVRALPVRDDDGRMQGVRVRCLGCGRGHFIRTMPVAAAPDAHVWAFDGDLVWPTITGEVACEIEETPLPNGDTLPRQFCRFTVREGSMHYHASALHWLAGQVVKIPLVALESERAAEETAEATPERPT